MKKLLLLLLICSVYFFSCSENNAANSSSEAEVSFETEIKAVYRKISAGEARKIMESADDFILLDVRTDEEYKEKRIDRAILIPNYELANRAELELPDKKAVILIYCRSGRRSASAAKELVNMGYTNVYDFGGINDWPYETTND